MLSRYHVAVDPDGAGAHGLALELVGWNKRVLELGAASGHVTRVLTERHCEVTAVEYEAEPARELEGLAAEVIVGDLNDENLLAGHPGGFDVVLAGDVLEHLVAPDQVLRRAARLLVPGGRAVLSVPNVAHADVRMSLLDGNWDYTPWGLLDRTHLRFFTRQAIESMVEQAGLVITDLHRVRIPAFESELRVDRAAVPTEVVNRILADPEAETYQFVLAAVREGDDDHVRRVAGKTRWLEAEVERAGIARAVAEAEAGELREQIERARVAAAAAEAELAAVRQQAQERELLLAERESTLAHQHTAAVAELGRRHDQDLQAQRALLDAAAAELNAVAAEREAFRMRLRRVDQSVTFQTLRRLRGAALRAAGGERSWPVRIVRAGLRVFGRAALRGR